MRKLKIYAQSMSGSNYTQVPTILLKGKWWNEIDFVYIKIFCNNFLFVEGLIYRNIIMYIFKAAIMILFDTIY